MMSIHYPFPHITHISDVLPHIDDESFRIVAKDSGHTFINYVRMGPDTFPAVEGSPADRLRAAMRRECRGIAFDTKTGDLVSRPFHKFFNACENDSLTPAHMGLNMEHVTMDKLDGSMVRPLMTEFGLRWGTKMGCTDTSNFAEVFTMDKPQYGKLAQRYHAHGMTALFEYVSPENRIVVEYKRNMVLLAIRVNLTGLYLEHQTVELIGDRYGIAVAGTYDSVVGDAEAWLASVKTDPDLDEGVVVAWPNGHRIKVKTDLYNVLHKVKEAGRSERTLANAILESKIDDLLAMLERDDRIEVDQFVADFWTTVDTLAGTMTALHDKVRGMFPDKKSFAISEFGKGLSQLERSTVFGLWDGKLADGDAAAMRTIESGLTSETSWDLMRNKIDTSENFNDVVFNWKKENGHE